MGGRQAQGMGKRSVGEAIGPLWTGLERGEEEAVHEARKLTRKVQAELRVADAPKKTKRAWRDLRRAVAGVRDLDAAGEHLAAALTDLKVPKREVTRFQKDWAAARQGAVQAMRLPAMPPTFERPGGWKRRVREALDSDRHELLQEGRAVLNSQDTALWHEWRKHLKRYRYTLETLDDSPRPLLDVLDGLGRMQDAEVARALLQAEPWLPAHRDALLKREEGAQQAAMAKVRAAWPALEAHLQGRPD